MHDRSETDKVTSGHLRQINAFPFVLTVLRRIKRGLKQEIEKVVKKESNVLGLGEIQEDGDKAEAPRVINTIKPPAYYPVPGQSLFITAPRYSALHLKLTFL